MSGLPRMRGDPPRPSTAYISLGASTPHARGSTFPDGEIDSIETVYPACAGIHLSSLTTFMTLHRLPRMRGDPPHRRRDLYSGKESTPHARGSTPVSYFVPSHNAVYPACAGIHPLAKTAPRILCCLPRMRGDPPFGAENVGILVSSTPHARGST